MTNQTDEVTITMKEHIEILSQQQDYQFKEGFIIGKKEGFESGVKSERENELQFIFQLEDDVRSGNIKEVGIKLQRRIEEIKEPEKKAK